MPEITICECGECGKHSLEVWDEDYHRYYRCTACGYEDNDSFADLFGCMSVPWGFLL